MKGAVMAAALGAVLLLTLDVGSAQTPRTLRISATAVNELREWDAYVSRAERSGDLEIRRIDRDPSLPSRVVERFQQYHQGVPVWGADVVRDSERGVPVSIFGVTEAGLSVSTEPALSREEAAARMTARASDGAVLLRKPELVIFRHETGEPRLAYVGTLSESGGIFRVFIDATSGGELNRQSEIRQQSAVGTGRGLLGDEKKLSVRAEGGTYFADDPLRPPVLRTYDFRGNFTRTISVLNGAALLPSDRASDADNVWTDVSAVDGHAHVGWTYDYFFKRHGRRGFDGNDRQMIVLINPLTPEGALTAPPGLDALISNAFWCGECGPNQVGVMLFGNGIPTGFFYSSSGQNVTRLAGSIDIVAHEWTHGVIDSSSGLAFGGESGALNEGYADMMGTSVEFFYQPAGSGRGQADYLVGEDSFRPQRPGSLEGIRSLSNPQMFLALPGFPAPDHYSRRYTGSLDDGGVHINAGIPGHAFYLAIEGGTNRTSGLAVQGVGAANREQIEKVFYRAFVFLLPASARFSTARAATIQAARDLYGPDSAVDRAVTQAWTAVGVF